MSATGMNRSSTFRRPPGSSGCAGRWRSAALIAWTAGEMMDSDAAVLPFLPQVLQGTVYLPLLLTVAVVGYGWWYNLRAGRTAKAVLLADRHAAERLEDRID